MITILYDQLNRLQTLPQSAGFKQCSIGCVCSSYMKDISHFCLWIKSEKIYFSVVLLTKHVHTVITNQYTWNTVRLLSFVATSRWGKLTLSSILLTCCRLKSCLFDFIYDLGQLTVTTLQQFILFLFQLSMCFMCF